MRGSLPPRECVDFEGRPDQLYSPDSRNSISFRRSARAAKALSVSAGVPELRAADGDDPMGVFFPAGGGRTRFYGAKEKTVLRAAFMSGEKLGPRRPGLKRPGSEPWPFRLGGFRREGNGR